MHSHPPLVSTDTEAPRDADHLSPPTPRPEAALLTTYLATCRGIVLEEIQRQIPAGGRYGPVLYDLALDYPMRAAKGLRPALCVATCRALGGALDAVVPTAAVLELYHNAFLLHDDVEDDSELRRGAPTLHRTHGRAVAINVGDAMLALAMEPLLDNTRLLGLGASLRVLRLISRMARESAEGQALELDWIRRGEWALADDDYLEMVHKKTSWYTFLAPMRIGAEAAGADPALSDRLDALATALGAAFQIRDDLLNLQGAERATGKEFAGDLWEGKRTLILLHALRTGSLRDRHAARAALERRRPSAGQVGPEWKSERDVAELLALIQRQGSLAYAAGIADAHADRARAELAALQSVCPPSVHMDFIASLVGFVVERDR